MPQFKQNVSLHSRANGAESAAAFLLATLCKVKQGQHGVQLEHSRLEARPKICMVFSIQVVPEGAGACESQKQCQCHEHGRPGGLQEAAGAYLRSWSLETLLKKHVLGCWACEVLAGVQLYSPGPGLYCSSKSALG